MFDRRFEIEAELITLSAMHIGCGEVRDDLPHVGKGEGKLDNTPLTADKMIRDGDGNPVIPSTAIKGLLRTIGESVLTQDEVRDVFGAIKTSEKNSEGRMGALVARTAFLSGGAPDASSYPYASALSRELGPGVFIAAHTAIDPRDGTAADHKLFFHEMLVPGARFKLRLMLSEPEGTKRLECLSKVLAALSGALGQPMGKGKADNNGALRLDSKTLKVIVKSVGNDGNMEAKSFAFQLPTAPIAINSSKLTLICSGPFISADSSWDPDKARGGDENKKVPQKVYQKGGGSKPLELGSQISGVLRARARWLAGLAALQDPTADLNKVDPSMLDASRVVRRLSDLETGRIVLEPVEKLFGVTGFAGLLRIRSVRFSGGNKVELTSVKIDHFSGAPIDKQLFTTEAVVGVKLDLELELTDRGGVAALTKLDKDLFKDLVEDIKQNGLQLGHGAAKGFGWFQISEEKA